MAKESNKTEGREIIKVERTPKFFIINFVTCSVMAIIIWPLLDILLAGIFQHNFYYNFQDHVLQPIIAMLILTIIEFLTWGWWHKDKK